MADAAVIDKTVIQQWVQSGAAPGAVEAELRAKGYAEQNIEAWVKEFQKQRNSKKQFKAFLWIVIGAMLGFISLVLGLTNPVPGMFNFFMFGLTSLAIFVVFYGLYLLFE
jgi:hypothetical protein